jgi:hypothetical protein
MFVASEKPCAPDDAQKRDKRFCPNDAVVVFNRMIREAGIQDIKLNGSGRAARDAPP